MQYKHKIPNSKKKKKKSVHLFICRVLHRLHTERRYFFFFFPLLDTGGMVLKMDISGRKKKTTLTLILLSHFLHTTYLRRYFYNQWRLRVTKFNVCNWILKFQNGFCISFTVIKKTSSPVIFPTQVPLPHVKKLG